MNSNNRWLGPVLIIVALVGTSLLTVIAPSILGSIGGGSTAVSREHIEIPQEPLKSEVIEIEVEGPVFADGLMDTPLGALDGQEVGSFTILLILLAIVTGAVFLFAGPIALFVMLGQRQTVALAADEGAKASAASMNARLSDSEKEKNKAQPKTQKPAHDRPQVDAWWTSILVVFMAYMFGYVLGDGISPGAGGTWANVFVVIAIALSWYFFRPQKIVEVEATSQGSVKMGSTFWVAFSGAIMMGLGVGLMYVVMAGGDPLPFIIWEPEPAINWEYLQELIQPLLT